MSLSEALKVSELKNIDSNSPEYVYIQKEILTKRKMILGVFKELYDLCVSWDDDFFSKIEGERIEIGSGSSLFKKYYPHVLATDIKSCEGLDRVLNAQEMNLKNESVGVFFGINCFHHFSDPHRFFEEVTRCLKPGGGCILIEPYYGFLASLVFKRLHDGEFFDKKQEFWTTPTHGPMKGANQALSYLIFERDRDLYHQRYPDLKIVYRKPLANFIRYLVSGGITFKSMLPNFTVPLLKAFEAALTPLLSFFALFHVIILRKNNDTR